MDYKVFLKQNTVTQSTLRPVLYRKTGHCHCVVSRNGRCARIAKLMVDIRYIARIMSVNYYACPQMGVSDIASWRVEWTIFEDSELRRTALYPFQSTLRHLWTLVGQVGGIVRILILTLLISTKFKVKCFQRNEQNGYLAMVVGEKLLSFMYC